MKKDYYLGRIHIERNFNKRGGKFFYVIRVNGEKEDSTWYGKIFFNKKKGWNIEFEKPVTFSSSELNFVVETIKLIEEDLK